MTEIVAQAAAKTSGKRIRRPRPLAGVLVLVSAALALVSGSGSAAAAQPLRVGLVLNTGLARDAFWIAGLQRAERDLGVEGRVLVPSPKEGYKPSLRSLARRGYGLIVSATREPLAAMELVAREFPSTRFAVLDVHTLPPRPPQNLWGIGFAEQEVGYLVGYVAARMEQRRSGRDVISSVGGMKVPQVDHFIAGYRAGARSVNPRIVTLNAYANSFSDQAKCRTVALGQIAKGSGVVFDVAGYCGYGALEAAESEGVWAIAVDTDESALGPHILTSALKRGSAMVFEVIRATIRGRFGRGQLSVFGLRHGALGLGKFSPRVPRSLIRDIAEIRRQIVNGTIDDIPTTVR